MTKMRDLPTDLIEYIFTLDDTYRKRYDYVMCELASYSMIVGEAYWITPHWSVCLLRYVKYVNEEVRPWFRA